MKKKDLQAEQKRERDEQIDLILQKVSEENYLMEEKLEEKYKNQMKNLEEVCEFKLNESELIYQKEKEKNENFQLKIKSLEQDIKELSQQIQKIELTTEEKDKNIMDLSAENSQLNQGLQNLQNQFYNLQKNNNFLLSSEIEKYNTKIHQLLQEQQCLKMQFEKQVNKLETEHIQQLQDVEDKVTRIFKKKENETLNLKEEIRKQKAKSNQLEEMLEQQRKNLISKS